MHHHQKVVAQHAHLVQTDGTGGKCQGVRRGGRGESEGECTVGWVGGRGGEGDEEEKTSSLGQQ